jgi:phage terminase large subunit GpA-like protein
VHEDVDVLTCGVDVHDNRIEAVVYGWDADETAYAVDHLIIGGPAEGQRVWRELDDLLSRGFEKADGSTLTIAAMCVDSGHQTQKVYDFVKPRQGRRVWAVKGVGGEGRPIIMAPARRKVGDSKIPVELHTVGVDEAKSTIYARLLDGDRFHFPSTEQFSEEFFRQLTSEKCVTKYRSGVAFRQWVKVRARNEILDCTVYALAAIKRLRPNWKVIKARRAAAELSDKNPDKGRISRPRRRSSYMHRWK